MNEQNRDSQEFNKVPIFSVNANFSFTLFPIKQVFLKVKVNA